ncbi:MAG: hypothetical protein AAFV80_06885, partial [Bacteroidota bacterium]
LEATVGLSDLKYIRVGDNVKLRSETINGEWIGTIKRVGETIDSGTQSAIVYVSVRGSDLKENMYLRGSIRSKALENVFELPRKLVQDDNSIYTIEDTVLGTLPLDIVRVNEETVIVSNLPEGKLLLKSPFTGAFPGFKVQLAGPDAEPNIVSEAASPEE